MTSIWLTLTKTKAINTLDFSADEMLKQFDVIFLGKFEQQVLIDGVGFIRRETHSQHILEDGQFALSAAVVQHSIPEQILEENVGSLVLENPNEFDLFLIGAIDDHCVINGRHA